MKKRILLAALLVVPMSGAFAQEADVVDLRTWEPMSQVQDEEGGRIWTPETVPGAVKETFTPEQEKLMRSIGEESEEGGKIWTPESAPGAVKGYGHDGHGQKKQVRR